MNISQYKVIDVLKIGTSLTSAAPIPHATHSVRIQRWLCFVDNIFSRTKV